MKLTKRIIVMILCVAIFASMQVFALEFPDVTDENKNAEAIDVLSSLGIIKGYEDGQFKPDKEVTRAELTSLLMRLLNLSITGTEVADSGYVDVANNHWAVYDIKTASGMGIIKGFGDGNFGPEQSVTFEQAVKMVVAMLGYESLAIDKGGWPDGYVAQGRDLGLLKNAEMTQTEPAPRKIIAQILYNALNVDLMAKKTTDSGQESYYIKKDQNVMTEYMKISKIEGMVTANSITRLDEEASELADDEVEIDVDGDSERYKVGNNTQAKNMIGLSVVAYVKYDEYNVDQIIQHIMAKSRITEVKFDAKEISKLTSSKLTVVNNDTGKTTEYKIQDDAVIMYNGKFLDSKYISDAKPTIGSVKLVDSGPGYNYIEIESYKNYLVKSVDTSNYLIYIDNSVGNVSESSIYVPVKDELDYSIKITKGTSDIQLSSIRKGNIISVKQGHESQTNGIQNIEILVSDTKKSGKITEENENTVSIDSKSYEISSSIEGTDLAKKIVYNASGTFYLDAFGDIAYAEFSTGDSYKYGFVIRAGVKAGNDEEPGTIRMLEYSTGSVKTYDMHTKVIVDGSSKSDHNEVVDALKDAAATFAADRKSSDVMDDISEDDASTWSFSQPIKYLVNSQGAISEIITVNTDVDDEMKLVAYESDATYNSTNKYFRDDSSNTIAKIDSKTLVLDIPNDRYDTGSYIKRTYSYFKNYAKYDIQIVGTNASGAANIVIAYESNLDKDVNYSTPTYVVKDRSDVYEDGENKTKLTLVNFQTGAEDTKYCSNPDYIADVEIGDVIRFGTDSQGEVNENVYIYLDISEAKAGNYPKLATSGDKTYYEDKDNYPTRKVAMYSNFSYVAPTFKLNSINDMYAYVFGTPYKVVDNSIELTDLLPGETGFEKDDVPTVANLTATSSTMFFSMNDNNVIEVTKGTTDENNIIGTILSYEEYPDSFNYIYAYIVDESLKAVYIIK